jgi:alpha-beta hydrolase superfamily lysophospholipase
MRRRLSSLGTILAIVALALAQFLSSPARAAVAADNPFQRGPDPTNATVDATRGPFATAQTAVSRLVVSGFGGGTIYYPTSTAEGTFGAVAVAPGFTATQSSVAWLGPRIASQGFVVFTIDTNSTFDQPGSRGDQLLAALDYLTTRSSVRTRVDATRLAVMGHSMGGGGTLEASRDRPSLQAAIGLTPWDLTKNWSGNRVPSLIVGAQADTVAPVAQHAIPFYTSLSATSEKAYVELAGASHFAPNSPNTTIARYSISWLKRFVDNDTRYDQFVCGAGAGSGVAISDYRTTCPLAG